MIVWLALIAGLLFAAGLHQLQQRSLPRILIGLLLLSNAANLALFTASAPLREVPPLAAVGESAPPAGAADPLPQALVLTAIVIGFAVLAFTGALLLRTRDVLAEEDTDLIRETDA